MYMVLHAAQIITSLIGWIALTFIAKSEDIVIASIIGSSGILHLIYQIKEYREVMLAVEYSDDVIVQTIKDKKGPSGDPMWTVERCHAEREKGTDDEWTINKFTKVGDVYFNKRNVELILNLLDQAGEMENGYNPNDYDLIEAKDNKLIYVMHRASGKPCFRLEPILDGKTKK